MTPSIAPFGVLKMLRCLVAVSCSCTQGKTSVSLREKFLGVTEGLLFLHFCVC